ncbi:Enoyl-ACP reductase [Mycena venus]|uniref:Enoyl-ACP reductase n=1 Tax=Mycena venus TaxID=2733690 RepID=A0A8H7CHD2_9AGAR|nr:Enoyl-ACP reductase [Mycena venus]
MYTADILVLGVGFTGLLVAETLARHRERSKFIFAIAGRSQEKLDAIVSCPPLQGIKAFRVDVSSSTELDHVVRQFRVVINCNSKYWKLGLPVSMRVCRNPLSRSHWRTAFLPQISSMTLNEDRHQYIVVFESTQKLREKYGADIKVSSSTTAMNLHKVFVSRGTAASGISLLQDVPRDIFWKSLEPFSLSPIQGKSSPIKLLYDLKPAVDLVGSFFLLAGNNVAAVNRTWGLLQSTGSPAAYGEDFQYTEFLVAPSSIAARIASVVALVVASILIYVPPIRWLVGWLVDRESTNPRYSELKTGSICVTNITKSVPSASNSIPHCAKTVFKTIGGDGGYMGSAVTVSECALLLLLHKRSELPLSSYRGFRVLTPMAAFGSLLKKETRGLGFLRNYDGDSGLTTNSRLTATNTFCTS